MNTYVNSPEVLATRKTQEHIGIITKDDILRILKGYRNLKKRVLQLEYELADARPFVEGEEIIVSMAISESPLLGKTKRTAGTDDIALSYAKTANAINIRHKKALADELSVLKNQKERVEFYISLLDDKEKNALTLIYIERLADKKLRLCCN